MGRRILLQLARGFAVTVSVCLAVQLVVAQICGSAVTPAFGMRFSNEGSAALAQLGLTGLIGAAFSASALLFEIERWSFLRQGVVHFLATAAVWVPVAWLCWMPISREGLTFTICGWTFTYIVNWTIQYFIYRRRIRELNRKISASREGGKLHAGD